MTFHQFMNLPRPVFAPDDSIAGGAGDDTLAGGGTDTLATGGSDTLATGSGDTAASGAGDTLTGGGDDDPFAWFGDELAADEKTYLENKSFKTPRDLFKSLRAAEKMIRGDKISGPPEDAEKHGDWLRETGLAKRLGIPDEAKDYGVDKPAFEETIADQIPYDDARHTRFLETAHKLNLTPAQAKGALDFYAAEMGGDVESYSNAALADETEMKAELTKEWGNAYDTNLRAAIEVAGEMGLDEKGMEGLRTGNVVGSATLTKILHELAVVRGNDTLKGGGAGGIQQSAQASQQEFNDFKEKNGKVLTDRNHPDHASTFAKFQDLKKRAGRGSQA